MQREGGVMEIGRSGGKSKDNDDDDDDDDDRRCWEIKIYEGTDS